ncbi:MAG: type II secretion system F family protein [Pseudomonadales bacterium]|nr:type II secretion system F family protein [Pseudomonadales bacterium]
MESVQAFLESNSQLLSLALVSFAFFCVAWVLFGVGQSLFKLYQQKFYLQVDKGLRDVVVMMDPGQVFTYTLLAALIVVPIVFFVVNIVMALIVAAIILLAPTVVLKMMKKRRSDDFVEQLPDALAAISSSLRSGLNLVKAFQQVVKNQPQPLAQEFAQVLVEYRVGTDLNDSLDDLARRIDRQDILLMNSAIKISRSVGGNLADTLETLSKTLREKSKVEGKIKALTSMGQAQGTLATFFPVFIGYVFYKIEPEAMSLLFISKLGWIWLGVMAFMAAMAYVMIRKIVNVDI